MCLYTCLSTFSNSKECHSLTFNISEKNVFLGTISQNQVTPTSVLYTLMVVT